MNQSVFHGMSAKGFAERCSVVVVFSCFFSRKLSLLTQFHHRFLLGAFLEGRCRLLPLLEGEMV